MKTVLVLGGSYGGASAARFLAKSIPNGHRIILLERNSHANHLYVFPRFSVIPNHEHKAFIPYAGLFEHNEVLPDTTSPSLHQVIHGTATRLERNRVTYTPAAYASNNIDKPKLTLDFDYLVYALGAALPAPIDLWGERSVFDYEREGSINQRLRKYNVVEEPVGSKQGGMDWLRKAQDRLKGAGSVLVVGGGALGIQFATDLKDVYPNKKITLIHSSAQLLPRFPVKMHDEINATLRKLGVDLILGQRLDLKTTLPENAKYNEQGERVVKTESGRTICADVLLLCTGQTPNTQLMREFSPNAVDPNTGMIKVLRTLQVSLPNNQATTLTNQPGRTNGAKEKAETSLHHMFAIGDSADAFGAMKAGHTAYYQAELAAQNIVALINHEQASSHSLLFPQLNPYTPGDPAIKVSVGLRHYAVMMGSDAKMTVGNDGKDDLDAPLIWPFYGASYEKSKDT